ncbi:MAG: hypothetical protein LBQ29_01920 [Acinetobacter sp.]|jgi:hypothetical protein|uniref:hypothetical protein n=1 Tax=Acinetobacter sp. TaxID=472 RepID=UPI00282D5266|nr:hypothetical protein [Acinetobacter sp.]MDR2060141.1 hypothetical protein [Acinetobacter sp.]
MVYKLSEQLDHVGNPEYIFEAYKEYLRENRSKLPASILNLIASEQWQGGSGSTAPCYCELQDIEIIDFGKATARLILTLIKKEYRDYKEKPFQLRLIYQGLLELNIAQQRDISVNPFIWRYDEFLFFDPWSSYGHNEKMFTHNIEWVGKNVWSITAKDLIAIWEDL